jgi:hypothetical protein
MAWRAMTDEEMVTRPEARLQGSLLLIVVCAAILAAACAISLLLALVAMPSVLFVGFSGLFKLRGPAGLGVLYAVPSLYLMLWAVAFTVLTLMRSSLAPSFAAGGLIGWLGVRLLISVVGQIWVASQYSGGPEFLVQSLVPMLLGFLGELMLVAGFWVYMRDGARPNGYYRRLVQG